MPQPFVHLHCHTDYSLLDGACEISQLMKLASEQKMPAVAMTDHGNLFGAVEFYTGAREKGVHPVIGCEVYVTQQSHTVKNESNRYNHLVLLCENQEGYKNLTSLASSAFLDGFYYKPRIDKDLLAKHSKGIIAMSACLRGDINEALMGDRYQEGKRLALEYADIFGAGNFFLEMQDHGLDQDRVVLPLLNRLSSDTGIPLVATNDSHYLRKDDALAQEVLVCINTGKTLSDENRMKFSTPAFYMKSREEMMELFHEVEHALDRTWEIAQRCQVKLEKVKEPFPKFDVPLPHSLDSYFAYVTQQGYERRRIRLEARAQAGRLKHPLETYAKRLEDEIRMIQQMKFSGYFLIVWDFIRHAKSQGIPVGPGRGSAAGSLVAFALGITDIDPLEYDLLFERFLNPQRISMPDIDIDFCTHRRGEVIQYVTEKYGRDYVAQIITFGTLAARAAIKDVGRVLGMQFGDVEKLTKLVPLQPLNIKLKEAFEIEPEFNAMRAKDPEVDKLLTIATSLEGMARNAGVHAAGVVISSTPLRELVPLYKTNRDEVVTQFDMMGLEKLNLLKMDFLGLTTLTIIHEAVALIEKHRGVSIVVDDIPLDDAKTYEIFAKGYTSGVFQFESSGMKDILRRYVPDRLTDLIALNALYRPGPMKMIDDYVDRKHGRKQVTYDVPEVKEVLEETFGIIVYQEQVMQISNLVGGYSLGEADILRRAMGKKQLEEMDAQRVRFLDGARANNIPPKKAEKIFDLLAEFAKYGFNKSHSAAYAYLAYITAYLKARYPTEFMAALLTSETGNTAKVVKYINECRDIGIKVLPPDVDHSALNFTPDGDSIRFGLGAIKNVGAGAVESIAKAREEKGRFKSLGDFCERVDLGAVNRRMIESFIKAGAMDSFEGTRSQQWAVIDRTMEAGQRVMRDRASGQADLFGQLMIDEEPPAMQLPKVKDWTSREKLTGEKETIGFYVTGHPLDEYRDKVKDLATHDTTTTEGLERGEEVAMCGVITTIQRRRNKEQKLWASFVLEDWAGTAECMAFAKVFEELEKDIVEDKPVLIRGMVMPEENTSPKISVKSIVPLEIAGLDLPSLVSVRVYLNGKGGDRARELTQLFERKQGKANVRLKLEKPRDFSVTIDVATRVKPDREFVSEIERICGPQSYEVLGR